LCSFVPLVVDQTRALALCIISAMKIVSLVFLFLAMTCTVTQAQAPENPAIVDGGLGPCSLEVTVVGADAKPVYGASVKMHIAYGFGGFHKLDLEVGTNADGKAKFTGLPTRVRRPPLDVNATKDDLTGTATFDPATQCQAKQQITVVKAPPAAQ
jgi:hypothetical protein